ncbi:MAG TPA: WecB/TagA/CpsF family glycosyltransferase [Rariglobus sp.]|nr:WecB/TagA/CpsF family glycosyltransferase [Rariglobus sp.]
MTFSQASVAPSTRRILGVDFFVGTLDEAVDLSLPAVSSAKPCTPGSRLVVAPSAPGLAVDLVHSPAYRHALQTADLVLTDSGFMVLLWRFFTGERLPRHSGLKFLRAVLERPELKQPGAVFWIMPSAAEDARNQAWLRAQGFPVTPDDVYIAPVYPATGELIDPGLVARLEARRPRVVMLAIGGGVQERLGVALRSQLSCESTLLCLGAAIAFLTGGQTGIPPWADRMILGWLLRLLSNPRKFWRRYWQALRLAPLLWRCRECLPAMR